MVEVYKWMKGYIKWGNNRVVNIQYQCKKKKNMDASWISLHSEKT